MTWIEFFNKHFEKLEEQIKGLEEMNKEGKLTPEKRVEAQKNLPRAFDELIEKMMEFVIKLTIAIAKGMIKGVIRAFRKE